jgi:hypothetical protein
MDGGWLTRVPFLLLPRNQSKGRILITDLLRVFARGIGMQVTIQDNVKD